MINEVKYDSALRSTTDKLDALVEKGAPGVKKLNSSSPEYGGSSG
jgi:hypothetical protein